jgi:hypothetical protein
MSKGVRVDIYTSLDELLDTRWATLYRLNPKAAEYALYHGYHERDRDYFVGVGFEEFKQAYAKRDSDTLAFAPLSEGIKLVKKLVNDIAEQMDTRPYYKGSSLVVNCYPYEITGEVLGDIHRALRVLTNDVLPISLVHHHLRDLTPRRCKDEFGLLLMYNPEEWLNLHMAELNLNPIPEVLLLTPNMFHSKNPTTAEVQEQTEASCHPITAFQALVTPMIEMQLIEVSHFCVIKNEGAPAASSEEPAAETQAT